MIEFQDRLKKEQEAQPTTTHYDHDKGSKYDYEWTNDEKFPHVATRLGYPELAEDPLERILGYERAPAHPGYQLQPFVQTPGIDPDPTLSFERGEIIYENRRVAEWIKLWKALFVSTIGFYPVFYTYEIYCGDGAPSLEWMGDNWNWFDIPRQFQDGSGWGLEGVRYPDNHDYMNVQYGGKRALARPAHTMTFGALLCMVYNMDFDYVTQMRYNKDKDLVFVKKHSRFWGERETVHEVHHLEQMVPSAVTAMKNLGSLDPNGITTVHDMGEKSYFKFYNEDKYWNQELKEEFMGETRSLWEGHHSDKYRGRIFQSRGEISPDFHLDMLKVDKELEEAVKKNGPVQISSKHIQDFYDRMEDQRTTIAHKAA